MNIPLNGRIAIIDNEIQQALPLMRFFAKNQIPYVFYKGDDLSYLPEEGNGFNDIRILFLDINLLNSRTPSSKEVKSTLYNILKRVIGTNNFPYTLVFWSRQESEYGQIVVELFDNELKDRKPISILPFVKSDFFPNFSDEEVENTTDIIKALNKAIEQDYAYSRLLNWENHVHLATDNTLQDVFSSYYYYNDWKNNANYILEKLGVAYLGKHYNENSPQDKTKASFISFNSVLKDTLEHQIFNTTITNPQEFTVDLSKIDYNLHSINEKLNLSKTIKDICEPGNVIVFQNTPELESTFGKLLNKVISLFQLKKALKSENKEIEDVELKKLSNTQHKKIKAEIKKKWIKLAVIVTPVCDFVQKENKIYDRIVKGLMIPLEYKEFIEEKSEALFILPFPIKHNEIDYTLLLDFRYFMTTELNGKVVSGLFRLRQELLSEIQSKLSRHINRQGILILDEN
jgi:hypothetical protein